MGQWVDLRSGNSGCNDALIKMHTYSCRMWLQCKKVRFAPVWDNYERAYVTGITKKHIFSNTFCACHVCSFVYKSTRDRLENDIFFQYFFVHVTYALS